jgi:hypothetical protein
MGKSILLKINDPLTQLANKEFDVIYNSKKEKLDNSW